jgi:phosphatidylinositol-3-phosphatase
MKVPGEQLTIRNPAAHECLIQSWFLRDCGTTRACFFASQYVSVRASIPASLPALLLLFVMIAMAPGCAGGSSGVPAAASVPQFQHVVLVVEENHSFSSVIGNSAMPYLNGLASQYSLATQYYADTHPSMGNYFMLTTGQVVTNDDNFGGTVDVDNIVRRLVSAGKTWKSYAEGLPAVGYMADGPPPYAKNHDPFSYFSDVAASRAEAANLVPFSQFSSDLASGRVPNFSFVLPNSIDDAHDGTLSQADTWLQQNIGPLVSSPTFQSSLLIIVFDESDDTDTAGGGGHVPAVIVSPKAKAGYKSTTTYQHQSTLQLILRALGVPSFPGAATSAPDMGEFF